MPHPNDRRQKATKPGKGTAVPTGGAGSPSKPRPVSAAKAKLRVAVSTEVAAATAAAAGGASRRTRLPVRADAGAVAADDDEKAGPAGSGSGDDDDDRAESGSGSDGGYDDVEMDGLDSDEAGGGDSSDGDAGSDGGGGFGGGQTKLASAMARILGSSSGVGDAAASVPTAEAPTSVATAELRRPILSKRPGVERRLDEDKLEARAARLLAAERKRRREGMAHVALASATDDFEKRLRRVATRGVVKLFNAIRTAQKSADVVMEGTVQVNAAKVPAASRTSFLQMIRESAGARAPGATQAAPLLSSTAHQQQPAPAATGGSTGAANAETGASVAWARDDFMEKEAEGAVAAAAAGGAGAWDLDSD
ncbi:hypothetical protein HK405_015944 [Cladochytrium tenue]|nr:hypothetical protein HK405_015944 [Cladochytrium tenue]